MKSGVRGVLLVPLMLAVSLGCSGASPPSGVGAIAPETPSQKTETVSIPHPSAPNESQEPESPPAASVGETPSETGPDLVQTDALEREAPVGRAWLTIRNTYTENQHVFVDDELFGFVPPGTTGRFELTPGAHRVTISDSEDGRSNPKSLSEVFDERYSYYYDVVAR